MKKTNVETKVEDLIKSKLQKIISGTAGVLDFRLHPIC